MKLKIGDREYDGDVQPFIGDLRLLKAEFGFGWGTVADRMQKVSEEANALELIDDDEFVDALMAWMWMVRLRSGERDVTITDIRQTPLDSFVLLGDEPTAAEQVEPDPTSALTDSGQGDEPHEPAAGSKPPSRKPARTSKTSNVRSISA